MNDNLCPWHLINLNVSNFEYLFWFFQLRLPVQNNSTRSYRWATKDISIKMNHKILSVKHIPFKFLFIFFQFIWNFLFWIDNLQNDFSGSHFHPQLSWQWGSIFKGQLISTCPFGVFKSSPKNNEMFLRISALASKKRSNQETKGTLDH